MVHLRDGFLTYVPEPLTAPKLVVTHGQRGVMLTHAQDAPCAGHHGVKATYETLKQVAYWPGMQQDVAEYVKGCLVCCQFKTGKSKPPSTTAKEINDRPMVGPTNRLGRTPATVNTG